ncbi:HAD family hydrolase [Christensenellaceae bacterium OttesenSCG-928-K19]|nr:HAD family hydrolase [Christensenellaceae bacterium OttesenSCG-928-K19]
MRKKYEAVLFDLDGTILDSFDLHSKVYYCMFQEKGYPTTMEQVRKHIGNTMECVLDGCGIPKEAQPEIVQEVDNYYINCEEDLMENLVLEEQVIDVIEFLKREGIKTGIVTNSKHALLMEIIRINKAEAYFDLLDGARADSLNKKVRCAGSIRKLGVTPNTVLYVGDTGHDIDLARECGMDICIVWHHFGWEKDYDMLVKEGRPDYVVDELKEILLIVTGAM